MENLNVDWINLKLETWNLKPETIVKTTHAPPS